MKLSLLALVLGFAVDLAVGDPHWLYHPVRLIGNLIAALENLLRALFRVRLPEDETEAASARERNAGSMRETETASAREKDAGFAAREFLAGTVLAVLVLLISSGVPLLLLLAAQRLHPLARLVLESLFCWQLLAVKSLRDESKKVYDRLREHDLAASRRAVSMIVGRDTERLDEAGVARAAVETVAENASDGVIAPLFYMAIGGAALGFFYKAVNTMDSMIGYRNSRYLYFGRFAAKLDDAANFLPARICALLMMAAAFLTRLDGKNAWRIFQRDRFCHASPNSAQTEAVMAGALRIRLAGDTWYFGELHKKEYIGDDLRPVEPEDILRAHRLLYATAFLALAAAAGIKGLVILLL